MSILLDKKVFLCYYNTLDGMVVGRHFTMKDLRQSAQLIVFG